MIVSISWLRQYVDIAVDAATLAHDLSMHGIKVERVTTRGVTERLVVVGHVLEANARARRFYERNGWRLLEVVVEPHFGGQLTEVARYRRTLRSGSRSG